MKIQGASDDTVKKAEVVIRNFLILDSDKFLCPLQSLSQDEQIWREITSTAHSGLRSVLASASLPFSLVQDSVLGRIYNRNFTSEKLRSLAWSREGRSDAELDQLVSQLANKKFNEFLESSEGQRELIEQIINVLHRHLESPSLATASGELLSQSLISTWSVFETFCRDFLVLWLNNNPDSALEIAKSVDLREKIGKLAITLETAQEFRFDLSRSMGEALLRDKRLDSLSTIRKAYAAILSTTNAPSLTGKALNLLNQRRHLLVHKRGVVDSEYVRRSGEEITLGERIVISSYDLENSVRTVASSIVEILNSAKEKQSMKAN